ncbi:hypothetical protein DB88DRAFT_497442 [Papiliotrema laurentii]|uniref:Uncharacterized protein n=1 Tax=Papiliotrema laurentii TaxID=5418 RepID=A0AAD9CUB2_PAPLA|nr:hypothetical protein DB88DRAFT_497442 [Papiliotrema laurentii]
MLLSPAYCHDRLTDLLSNHGGPHTALLATPNGQLVSRATTDRSSLSAESEEGLESEPWLDEPERTRLLLGLLSQWEEHESPRIECELGRLYVRSIDLPTTEPTSHASMPSVRSPHISRFILLVNGSSTTPWADLERQASVFVLT